MKDKWVVVCAPNAGFIDACLPVLNRLRERCPGDEILCLFPSAKTASDFAAVRSSIADFARDVVDVYAWPVGQGVWAKCSSFEELNMLTHKTTRLESWCDRWLRPGGVKSRVTVRQFLELIERTIKKRVLGRNVIKPEYFSGARAVLTDTVALRSPTAKNFRSIIDYYRYLKDTPHFLFNHGLYVIRDNHGHLGKGVFRVQPARSIWFINHENEADACINAYGFKRADLRVVGVPRHDRSWMDAIVQRELGRNAWSRNGYVLLISRPAGDGALPRERKLEFLKSIKRVVCDENGLELVVKMHPKETDQEIFEQALDSCEFDKRWSYAGNHPFVLGSQAAFVISFWSGVCVDMIRLGKITIELNDVRGLDWFDHEAGFKDADGRPVTEYEHYGLVRPAHSEEQLREEVSRIRTGSPDLLRELETNYARLFAVIPDVTGRIVEEILADSQ